MEAVLIPLTDLTVFSTSSAIDNFCDGDKLPLAITCTVIWLVSPSTEYMAPALKFVYKLKSIATTMTDETTVIMGDLINLLNILT